MNEESSKLTVFFEDLFWIGIFERISEGKLSVCKIIFGTEPKDYEVYDFILKNYYHLRFSPAVTAHIKKVVHNPKRMQREVQKQTKNTKIGTKSQQALKLQQEQLKTQRKTIKRKQKEAEKEQQYKLKQRKRKEKHKGK